MLLKSIFVDKFGIFVYKNVIGIVTTVANLEIRIWYNVGYDE